MEQKIGMRFFLCMMSILMLGGCRRIIYWGKQNFYQGESVQQCNATIEHFIKSVTVYDQFSTQAIFDVLWLADDVRTAYAHAYGLKRGKTVQQKNLFLRRQLEENKHFISFYVLTTHKVPLSLHESEWHILLMVDGIVYEPLEIKKIDLPDEYKSFFGCERYNRFKLAYHVKFDAKNIDDLMIINRTTNCSTMELQFRAVDKHIHFTWDI